MFLMWRDLIRVMLMWRSREAWLAAGMVVAAGSALAGVAMLAIAGNGLALLTGGAALAGAVWLRALVVLRPAARWSERMATHAATFRALADTRVWFFRRLAERLPAGIGLNRAGDLLGRLVADVEALDGLYLRSLVPATSAFAVVLTAALLLGASPLLAAVVAAPMTLALLLPLALAPGAAREASEIAVAQGALRAAAVDPLVGLEDTLAANGEARANAVLAASGAALARAQHKLASRAAWAGAGGGLLTQAAMLGALAVALMGGASAGLVALGLFLAVAAAESMGALPRAGVALAAAAAGARRLFEAADVPPPVAEPTTPAAPPEGHAIVISGVDFRWSPDRPPVFEGLDLEVPEGARIALLGPSGIGKSSLGALLLKLAAPQAGSITLGGVPIADLPADFVRHRIACLTQDARLFDDTIEANLRIAAPEAPVAALWRALDRAGLGQLVRGLPEQLATECGEGGVNFSGGQARRLALARVLLSAAPVVILDEPTAGLDPETERAFLATLEEATAGRSVLLLNHRLTGVEHPTRVLRLVGGRALPAAG